MMHVELIFTKIILTVQFCFEWK